MNIRKTALIIILWGISAIPSIVVGGECFRSSIVSPIPFMGNNGEIFKLSDGSIYEVKYEYEYLYEYYPNVIICPGRGKLIIGKKSLNVELISQSGWEVYEETNIQGSVSGTIRQGHIFKTISGSVYEVTDLTLQLVLEFQPEVMVLRNGNIYKLVIEGFDEPLNVELISQSGWEVYEETNIQGSVSCLLYTSPSPRDRQKSRMPSSA